MSLAEDFKKVVEAHSAEIDALVAAARAKLKEATALSEKHGIPFYSSGISAVGQAYRPKAFDKIKSDIEDECDKLGLEAYEVFDEILPEGMGEYRGWQASAICY